MVGRERNQVKLRAITMVLTVTMNALSRAVTENGMCENFRDRLQ